MDPQINNPLSEHEEVYYLLFKYRFIIFFLEPLDEIF